MMRWEKSTRWVFTALLLVCGFAVTQTTTGSQQTTSPTAVRPKVSGPMCTTPAAALRAGVEERTLLDFHVGADGQITDVVVDDSSGNADLDQAAIHCFKNWHADASEATGFGDLRAHIFWNSPAGASKSPTPIPVGTFTVNRLQTCDSFYPADKLKADIAGAVLVGFHVTTEGTVSNPAVSRSSGDAELDRAALSCVRHWRYQPAVKWGRPIEVPWKAQIRFESPLWKELGVNADACLKDTVVANQAITASAGTTQLSVRIPATGPAQVSIAETSGYLLLDKLAAECFAKAAPQPSAIQQTERAYHYYVPWKALLSVFASSQKAAGDYRRFCLAKANTGVEQFHQDRDACAVKSTKEVAAWGYAAGSCPGIDATGYPNAGPPMPCPPTSVRNVHYELSVPGFLQCMAEKGYQLPSTCPAEHHP